ncbi:MAG: hypothetical protein ABUK01_06505 [Leptospirales bacterium]
MNDIFRHRIFHFFYPFTLIIIFVTPFKNSFSITGGLSPTIYLEDAASTTNLSLGGAGQSEELGQIWYNPAYLFDRINGRIFGLTYIADPSGFQQNFAFFGYAMPTKIGKFVFGLSYLGNSLLERYDSSGVFGEYYNTAEILGGGAHIWRPLPTLTISETIKAYYFNYYYIDGFAVSLDLGLVYNPVKFFRLSFSIDNIANYPFQFNTTYEFLPVILKIGPQIVLLNGKGRIFYMMDVYLPVYETVYEYIGHRLGMEFDIYRNYFTLRAGFDGNFFTLGVGTQLQTMNLNFAFMPRGYENLASISLTYFIDKNKAMRIIGNDGQEVSDDEIIDFYEGMQKYNNENYRGAYSDFERVLEQNPEHEMAKLYMERALLHLKTSDWMDEEESRLIKLHKDLAKKYEAQKNYGDAIYEWRKVDEINPADKEAKNNISRIQNLVRDQVIKHHKSGMDAYGANNKTAAIESFSSALSFDPEYEPSKEMLLKIKNELSDTELAERERIEKLQQSEVFYTKGLQYYSRKSFEESINMFDQALKLNPDHLDAQKYRQMAIEEWEREKMGLKGIEAANKIYEKGIRNFDEDKYYQAIQDFRLALKIYPTHEKAKPSLEETIIRLAAQVQPFILEGTQSYQARLFTSAIENFKAVLKLDPDNVAARNFLVKINKEKKAIVKMHYEQGKKFYETGKKNSDMPSFSKAIKHLNEVVQLDSSYKEAKVMLDYARKQVRDVTGKIHKKALANFNNKIYDQAIKGWEQVLEIDPANELAKQYLDQAKQAVDLTQNVALISEWNAKSAGFLENREFERALVYLEKTLSVDPNHKEALALKKRVLQAKKAEELQSKISILFIEGVREYKRRNYDEAIAKWQEVKKLDPENTLVDRYIPKAREAKLNRKRIDYIKGMEYYEGGKWLLAESSFQRALKEDPGNREAKKMLLEAQDRIEEEKAVFEKTGDENLKAGKYEEAAGQYARALRLRKTTALALKRENSIKAKKYFDEGEKYLNSTDQIGLSIVPFLKVLEINPYDKVARSNIEIAKEKGKKLIKTWISQAQDAEAKKDFKKSNALYTSILVIEPNNVDALKGQSRSKLGLNQMASFPYKDGKEAMALKNYSLAIEKFSEVQELVKDYEETPSLLAQARKKRQAQINQRNESRRTSGSSTSSGGSSSGHEKVVSQGIVLYRQGKYKEAIAVWSKVPKSSSSYSAAQKYIARARLKL